MANVLIVDDTSFMRFFIRKIIEGEGHTIIGEAMNGQQAITQYFNLKPDLVILDVTLPIMDGIEALKHIYSRDPKAKVVMCSAYGHMATVKEAISNGAKDFIIKPFEKERLTKAIGKMICL